MTEGAVEARPFQIDLIGPFAGFAMPFGGKGCAWEWWACGFGHRYLPQDWTKPFILQVSPDSSGPEVTLTFRTLGGNVAASINWNCADPPAGLPAAVLTGIRGSGFECPLEALRVGNLRLLKPDGTLVDVSPDAAPLAEQLASHVEQ